ncbi:MAG: DEAD/DEAH box helicase [Candidatus Latescibacteria bacterium]|nr:DEAD/DEAH box helicase [Candidatus Latescibacterota bacterium]
MIRPVPFPDQPPESASVQSYLQFLKQRVLGDAILHEETIPARPERLVSTWDHLPPSVGRVLEAAQISALYSHQDEGIRHILAGRHTVMATPTASGKTLVYNAPIIGSLLDDPDGHALYLFPLKALEQDQFDELNTLLERLEAGLRAAIYDGDTTSHQRQKIKKDPPHLLVTTPDMLHAGFLGFHEQWAEFFGNLRYVVIDELHTYSGVFGTHVLHLFRRLNRVCSLYGSDPVFITCSATIGNPETLATNLLNRPFQAVVENGAPAAPRHFLFLNPHESPNTLAAQLLRLSVLKELRTIVFTRARVITELIYRWATQNRKDLRERISSYRAGYLPEERREIETALNSGELLGVVSTSALELGIDIGGLDVCVLVGYPGSIVNTWQRAGRVGRAGRESIILLIASRDALDQYFMKNPAHFFGRDVEDAVVDPSNKYILKSHLACAAREVPLTLDEPEYRLDGYREALDELVEEGHLLQSAEGDAWYAARKQPHRLVNMRTIGESWSIYQKGSKYLIGTVSGGQIYSECYDGAVYLHRGRQYQIEGRDAPKHHIYASEVDVPYYTRAKSEKETEIIEEVRSRPMPGYMAKLGRLKVSSQVVAYEKVRVGDQIILSKHPLEAPVEHFETVGFWLEMDAHFKRYLKRHGFHHMGSIHAIEHAVKSLFPLLALSSRTDVGGICYPLHPQLRKSAIFIYDYHPGGIGLAEKGFALLDRLLEMTLDLVQGCECEGGCPSCIHFPTCGAGNVPLDKPGCIHLLEILTGKRTIDIGALPKNQMEDEPPLFADWEDSEEEEELPGTGPHIVVFDLETMRSAAEVGGWNKAHMMGMSVGIVWDSKEGQFSSYFEEQVDDLIAHLQRADLVIGFNIIGFDYSVLRGYSKFDFRTLNTLDILRDVHARLRYRVSLDSLGKATLEAPKTADGLQALQWFKEGRLDLIEEYCRKDVELTRDLFRYGLDKGYLLFDRKNEGRMRVPLDWDLEELAKGPDPAQA